ncbi:MAG TPA: peptidoglycan-binding protein, partial [Longimicrobiaceae bacterium]|nr:peptidoglycan-binding protein [Longimicrobiaceae bacterium]
MNTPGKDAAAADPQGDAATLHDQLRSLGFPVAPGDAPGGETTRAALEAFQRRYGLEPTGRADEGTRAALAALSSALRTAAASSRKTRQVRGVVRLPDGTPLVGGTVRALHRELRGERPLGEARTDSAGKYRIEYPAGDDGAVDLAVRVVAGDGAPVAESPVHFDAREDEEVDLALSGEAPRGAPEWEALAAELAPVMGGLAAAELSDEDAAFLAGKTGADARRAVVFARAARLEAETGAPAALFYGLLRNKLPADPGALLTLDRGVLRQALDAAVRQNVVAEPEGGAGAALERFGEALAAHAARPGSALSEVLAAGGAAPEARADFLRRPA